MAKTTKNGAKVAYKPSGRAEFYYNCDVPKGIRRTGRKAHRVTTRVSVDAMEGQGDRAVGLSMETTVGSIVEQLADVEFSVAVAEELYQALGEAIATARGCHGR